jgi:hypothetical protein
MTDAEILMGFRDTVTPLKRLPWIQATEQMSVIGRPYFEQLRDRHGASTAISLLREVWNDIPARD